MDSGPLHVAKMFNKRGVLIETSVSSKIFLKNYKLIKGIKNSFLSHFCKHHVVLLIFLIIIINMAVLIV